MAYTRDCNNVLGLPLINGGTRPYSAGYDLSRVSNYRGGSRTGVTVAWPPSTCGGSDPSFVYPPRPPAEQIQVG